MTDSAVLSKICVGTPILQDLVSRAVKGSTMVEIIPLSCLMEIKVKDNVLTVRTTDNINYLTATANVNAPDFCVIVQSKLFSQTIAKLSTATTTITVDGDSVIIEANGKYTVPVATDADGSSITFPDPQFEPIGNSYKLTYEQVKSILTLNKSCKSDNKEIPAIFNYYMDNERVLTTNMFKGCTNPVKMFDNPTCLPPNLVELIPTVVDSTEGVTVEANDTSVRFSSKLGSLLGKKCLQSESDAFPSSALIEVFGADMEHECNINRTLLSNAVDRMCLFTDPLENNKLTLTFAYDKVTLSSEATKSHEDVNYITPLANDFEPVTFDIDGGFLKNELSACQEDIHVKFSPVYGLQMTNTYKANNVDYVATLALSILGEE